MEPPGSQLFGGGKKKKEGEEADKYHSVRGFGLANHYV
jgi:hypothetical protein